MKRLIKLIVSQLSDDLRKKEYKGLDNKLAGHCYIASEALHHLCAKKTYPCHVSHEGKSHWYLIDEHKNVIDITADQFKNKPDYSKGRRIGFLTKKPCKRTKILIDRIRSLRRL